MNYLWLEHYIHINTVSLWKYYKRNGINYLKANSNRKSLIREQELHDEERSKTAWELLSLLVNKHPVCYIDETTV